MATITMHLQVRTQIGIAPSEMGREQDIDVHIDIEVDNTAIDRAAASGRIDDTLDYGALRRIVHQRFAAQRFDLLEQATAVIRRDVLALPHVLAARVGISKHHAWSDVPTLTLTR